MSQEVHNSRRSSVLGLNPNQIRGEWVRQQTLIFLRWLAISGQSIAIIFAVLWLDIQINLWPCILAIGASAVYNLYLSYGLRLDQRLTSQQALMGLGFDLIQLLVMLYLTGGLSNPFSVLLLAPITISATALRLNATVFLGAIAILGITALIYVHQPLRFSDGRELSLSAIQIWGVWVSLIIGMFFLAAYARRVTLEIYSMSEALAATQMALEREHKLTLLGGVVSAAAHEMGTPLATIKMVATELEEELRKKPAQREDALLIKEQAERLSNILKDMGRAGKQDLLVQTAPFPAVVMEAAEPHSNRGKHVHIMVRGKSDYSLLKDIPMLPRSSEIIHGLRNLVQNAVDFADKNVWIDLNWNDSSIDFTIRDDGPGFPYELMGRIGDPMLRRSRFKIDQTRPEYDGMGLGLFIAKTLLERSMADIQFSNIADTSQTGSAKTSGAMVTVSWPKSAVLSDRAIGAENPQTTL